MPVVEAPTFHDWPVLAHVLAHGEQRYGQFVFFRLDPLASVAILDDAEASRAAALLPQDWFLGIVIQNGTLGVRNAKGRALLNFNVYLLGEGPADPVSAAIPISPAPQLADDHPPIQLDAELPWSNLYAHSFYSVIAVIARIHDGPDLFPVALTAEQTAAFVELATHDQDHRYDAVREERAKQAEAQQSVPAPAVEESDSASSAESIASYDFMLTDEAQSITSRFIHRNEYGELWLDPTSCPGQPAPPSACLEVLNRLSAIAREWYDRKIEEAKARRPQQIMEWTQAVGDIGADQPTDRIQADEPRPALDDDDEVRPEDAVDYQAQPDDSQHPRDSERPAPVDPAAGSEPTASVNRKSSPEGRCPASDAKTHTPESNASVPTPLASQDNNTTPPPKSISAKSTSIVRKRFASIKQAAVNSVRFVFARVRARNVRGP